jgi:diguanylate cyclase (GGDEF)-like protein
MSRFLKLNIKTKIIIGFIPILLIMIIIAIFSFFSLKEADRINRSFVELDMVLLETADKLVDELLAQESYGRRYIILESPEMLNLFWDRSKEFDKLVTVIQSLPDPHNTPARKLSILHTEFNTYYQEWFKFIKNHSAFDADENDRIIKNKLDELISFVQTVVKDTKKSQRRLMLKTGDMGLRAIQTIIFLSSIGILIGFATVSLITRNIARSINQLKIATMEISKGKFDHIPKVNTRDELGELAGAFKKMARRLARLEEMCLDASPLTRLPGGVAIESVLKKRLAAGRPLAFGLIDLDNFKSYNDRYGYAKGNDIITASAKIIESAVAGHGTKDDFAGHIGGDDFAIITTPEKYASICQTITENFDKNIGDFYDYEDRKKGCITSKNRQDQEMEFPIMTVSIAVVITSETKQMNQIEIGEIAAELKKYAKSLPGSVFVVNRREIK